MMINSLYTAQSGLFTARYSIDTTSNNIANENTEGYNKRVVNTTEISSLNNNDIGSGVSFDGVTRTVSEYLFTQLTAQNSKASYYETEDSILSNIETMFSETESSGFSTTLSDYFNAIETLRGTSSSSIYKTELQTQSDNVVSQLQTLYSSLEESTNDAFSLLEKQVDEVNQLLQEIVYVNEQIVQSTSASNDLLDKRDQLESELSAYTNIEVDTQNGNYSLKIGGVTAIFNNTNLHEVSLKEKYISQKDIYDTNELSDSNVSDGETISITLNNTTTISFTASTSGVSQNELKNQIVDEINNSSEFSSLNAYLDTSNDLIIESNDSGEDSSFDLKISLDDQNIEIEKNDVSTEASNNISVTIYNDELNLTSGSMKSLTRNLTTSTSTISEYKQSLDDFAKALVENTSANSDTKMFNGSSVDSLEFIDSSIDLLTSTDLENLAQIQWSDEINIDSSSEDKTSFSDFYQNLLVSISSNVENNDFKLETQEAINNSLQSTYDNLTKVDSDEEMINLLKYQAAYEANAKVITVVDEMLETLLNM